MLLGPSTDQKMGLADKPGGNRLQCEYCLKSFHNLSEVNDHVDRNHKSKNYVCTACLARFQVKDEFYNHIKTAHGKVTKQCKKCGKGFKTLSGYRNHVKIYHGDTSKLPKCNVCGSSFSSVGVLVKHLKSHIREKEFQCLSCNKSFMSKWYLNKHKCNDASD